MPSDPRPRVVFDFEFQFAHVAPLYASAEEGRDTIAADEARIRLELHPEPGVTEELIVQRSELAYMRTTKREIAPSVTVEDAGSIRLVGSTP